jgi:hypothetical protein
MNYVKLLQELGCRPPSEPADNNIAAIEDGIGVPLPQSYRAFLEQCGDWWGDVFCPCQEPTPFGELSICSFHDVRQVCAVLDSNITPRNMITIATGHFTKYACLSIAGIDCGAVYALDGEFRCWMSDEEFHQRYNAIAPSLLEYLRLRREDKLPEKPISYTSLYFIANDFDEFVRLCEPVGED